MNSPFHVIRAFSFGVRAGQAKKKGEFPAQTRSITSHSWEACGKHIVLPLFTQTFHSALLYRCVSVSPFYTITITTLKKLNKTVSSLHPTIYFTPYQKKRIWCEVSAQNTQGQLDDLLHNFDDWSRKVWQSQEKRVFSSSSIAYFQFRASPQKEVLLSTLLLIIR